jgi:hypothetical protein
MRVRILATLGVSPASTTDLARSLSQPICKIAYHLAVLSHVGYIVPVEGEDPGSPHSRYESSRI